MPEFLDHLNDESFEQPVRIRLRGGASTAILPTNGITKIFDHYGLTRGDSFDVAATVEEPIREFSFDSSKVEESAEIVKEIRAAISEFNTPPEELSEDKIEEWEKRNVEIEVFDN